MSRAQQPHQEPLTCHQRQESATCPFGSEPRRSLVEAPDGGDLGEIISSLLYLDSMF